MQEEESNPGGGLLKGSWPGKDGREMETGSKGSRARGSNSWCPLRPRDCCCERREPGQECQVRLLERPEKLALTQSKGGGGHSQP